MTLLAPNKQLGPGDLTIVIRDPNGAAFTPYSIQYSIFHDLGDDRLNLVYGPRYVPAGGSGVWTPNQLPPTPPTALTAEAAQIWAADARLRQTLVLNGTIPPPTYGGVGGNTGVYWISMTVPSVWSGKHRLVWYVQQTPEDQEVQVYEDFEVVPLNFGQTSAEAPNLALAQAPGTSQKLANLIAVVRELLSDENPDRNYHFRPPTPGKTVAGYSTRVGFIWEDRTILRMLDLALVRLCTANPLIDYQWNLNTAPDHWAKAACVGAAAFCLTKEAARWAADEFGYSLNGVSLDINKAQTYQSLGSEYQAEFEEWAKSISATKPASVGLRQSRWLLG